MDLSIKDALAPLGAVLAGVITGLLAGERRIRAERTAERERRRTELRQRDSSEALDALMAYLTKRPSLASVRDLVELVPPGRPIPELRSLLDELKEAANRLQVLVPDEEDMALVRQDERSADVVAKDDVEVLAVDERFLQRIQRRYPRIAARVFLNLTRILSDRLQRMNERLVGSTQ